MANIPGNHFLAGVKGKVGSFIFKQVNGKTIMTIIPDMSNVPVSERQADNRRRFKAAVAYAKSINDHPQKKLEYAAKLEKGQTVFKYALKEFFMKHAGL